MKDLANMEKSNIRQDIVKEAQDVLIQLLKTAFDSRLELGCEIYKKLPKDITHEEYKTVFNKLEKDSYIRISKSVFHTTVHKGDKFENWE